MTLPQQNKIKTTKRNKRNSQSTVINLYEVSQYKKRLASSLRGKKHF